MRPAASVPGQAEYIRRRPSSVTIPAGVEDGTRIRLSGEGRLASMAHRPETYIFLSQLRRTTSSNGTVLTSFVKFRPPFTTASLGGHIEVPTVDGSRARITIPSGTQSATNSGSKQKACPSCARKSGETCLCKPQWRRRLIYQKKKRALERI